MEIKVNFLDKLRLEAKFDDFTVVADQPIRYKGDGSAPGPFDYFLASSALCAAYFVKLYCSTRNIPTENIRLSQNNIVDPENRYQQIFKIQVELPADISAKDRQGILRSIDRCTVKKVVQAGPEFVIEEVENLDADAQALLSLTPTSEASTYIAGKDLPLEQTIANMSGVLAGLGIKIEIASWRNLVPNVWSLHVRDAHSPMCFTNGKGATKESALASAWANISSASITTISTPGRSGAKTSPTQRSCTTPTSAGSSLAEKMRCRPEFWMRTACKFTTPMANCGARI
jgi:ribosomal protein S12 methylthiotransferase accessory factor